MLSYLFLFSLITTIISYEPCYTTYRFVIPNKKSINILGKYKLFKDIANYRDKSVVLYKFSEHCKNDETLCCKLGEVYEETNDIEKDIINDYKELNNRCCGEVNEKDEIEQLEIEFFEIFQRIKNYNKKRNYNN